MIELFLALMLRKKSIPQTFRRNCAVAIMQRFSAARIHDAGRQESISLQLANLLECNAAAVEARLLTNSDPLAGIIFRSKETDAFEDPLSGR